MCIQHKSLGVCSILEDIEKSECIYDILAAANKALGSYSTQDDYTPEKYMELTSCIERFDRDCDQNKGAFFRKESFDQLRKEISTWLSRRNVLWLDVYALVLNIDRQHSYRKSTHTPFSGNNPNLEVIASLNKLHDDSLQILPRLNSEGLTLADKMNLACKEATGDEFRVRNAGETNSINFDLNNFDIFIKDHAGFSPIIHRFTGIAAKKISKRLTGNRKYLTVGLFPLWAGNRSATWEVDLKETTFTVMGIEKNKEERMLQRLMAVFKKCKEMKVDIVVFPEMIMTRNNLNEIKKYIASSPAKDDLPFLMIMGTIWEKYTKDGAVYKRNVSVALSPWGELFGQEKKTPLHLRESGHRESLSLNDKTINVIDIKGVGRFFTYICRDVLNMELISLAKKMHADMVLVPAFSRSKELKTELRSLVSGYWATALLCNCCSATHDDNMKDCWMSKEIYDRKELGFVMAPAKNGSEQIVHTNALNMSDSCINCQTANICSGGIFDIHYGTYCFDKPTKSGRIHISRR